MEVSEAGVFGQSVWSRVGRREREEGEGGGRSSLETLRMGVGRSVLCSVTEQ
jgi:hypothetical protein